MNAEYVRLFADDSGESHFENVSVELASVEFTPGIPNLFTSTSLGSTSASFFGAPGGWEADWHPSSGRHLFAVLSGMWEVTASDGEVRTFAKGDVLLVEDTTGKGHTSRVISQEESIALLVQLPD